MAHQQQQQSDGSRQLVYLWAGAGACFLAGWSAHALLTSRRSLPGAAVAHLPQDVPQVVAARPSAASSLAGNASALSTPRESTAASMLEGSLYKMAILVRSDLPQLGRGRVAVLCAHGVLAQYRKIYRRRDPARAEWEEEGSKKLCLAVPGDLFPGYRQAAKEKGVATYQVSDPRVTGHPENMVLVVGPAASSVIDSIVGDLKLLD